MKNVDETFYARADAHIHLSNSQMTEKINSGMVSASFLYGASRFNAWVSACGYKNSEDMGQDKEEMIKYFMGEYRKMLEENLDDYIANFNSHMQIPEVKE